MACWGVGEANSTDEAGQHRWREGALLLGAFEGAKRRGDWREPEDSRFGPAAPEKALCRSEAATQATLSPTLRQGVSGRCIAACLCTGEIQRWSARCGWRDV